MIDRLISDRIYDNIPTMVGNKQDKQAYPVTYDVLSDSLHMKAQFEL